MTSGVKWNECFTNPMSDVARFIRQKPATGVTQTVSYMRKLKRSAPAGTKWNYNTGETNLLGVLVAQATDKPLSEYLSEKIWKPYGMEADALWALDVTNDEMGGCCLSASLRDYARFGQFMLGGAKIDGQAIVPDNWIKDATSLQEKFSENVGFSYGWWTLKNEVYMAQGAFGQLIAIDPRNDLVTIMIGNTSKALPGKKLVVSRLYFLAWIAKVTKKDTGKSKINP